MCYIELYIWEGDMDLYCLCIKLVAIAGTTMLVPYHSRRALITTGMNKMPDRQINCIDKTDGLLPSGAPFTNTV